MELGFTSKFPNGFNSGNQLVIEATPKNDDAWLSISLLPENDILVDKYDEPRCPIIFQIQLRLDEGIVVLNSMGGSSEGGEERHVLTVDTSEKIKIKLKANDEEIKIILNGNHLADFKHRQHLSSVNHLNVYGDFIIKRVAVK